MLNCVSSKPGAGQQYDAVLVRPLGRISHPGEIIAGLKQVEFAPGAKIFDVTDVFHCPSFPPLQKSLRSNDQGDIEISDGFDLKDDDTTGRREVAYLLGVPEVIFQQVRAISYNVSASPYSPASNRIVQYASQLSKTCGLTRDPKRDQKAQIVTSVVVGRMTIVFHLQPDKAVTDNLVRQLEDALRPESKVVQLIPTAEGKLEVRSRSPFVLGANVENLFDYIQP